MNTQKSTSKHLNKARIRATCLTTSFLCILSILFFSSPVFCVEQSIEKDKRSAPENSSAHEQSTGNLGSWLASFFRDHISAVDGDRCPSRPSCSSYSVQAFRKHGFFVGWVMTVDRLIHEGDEPSVSPMVRSNGKYYVFDPVENNDFWWYHKEAPHED
jgi:hypothetical protein